MSERITIRGGVDLHVHLREPGTNSAENISSGTRAALLGGYALVCDMPNNPGHPTWTTRAMMEKHGIIAFDAYVPVATYAGSQPESDNVGELASMAKLAIGLKLYGAPTTGNERDYEARDFAEIVETWHKATPDKPVMLHAGKDNLEDFIALVAGEHGHPLHVCHVHDPHEIDLVEQAKEQGLAVTCGVCPHHLFKTSHDVLSEGWPARMQPPLAHQADAEKLLWLLAGGKIDAVETDHAPHTFESKMDAEEKNPEGIHDPHHQTCFGVPGIEFAMPLLFYQVKCGRLSLERLVEVCAIKPAEIIGIKNSSEVTWDMTQYRVGHDHPYGVSGSGWTPYMDKMVIGKVESAKVLGKTLVGNGRINQHVSVVGARGMTL